MAAIPGSLQKKDQDLCNARPTWQAATVAPWGAVRRHQAVTSGSNQSRLEDGFSSQMRPPRHATRCKRNRVRECNNDEVCSSLAWDGVGSGIPLGWLRVRTGGGPPGRSLAREISRSKDHVLVQPRGRLVPAGHTLSVLCRQTPAKLLPRIGPEKDAWGGQRVSAQGTAVSTQTRELEQHLGAGSSGGCRRHGRQSHNRVGNGLRGQRGRRRRADNILLQGRRQRDSSC